MKKLLNLLFSVVAVLVLFVMPVMAQEVGDVPANAFAQHIILTLTFVVVCLLAVALIALGLLASQGNRQAQQYLDVLNSVKTMLPQEQVLALLQQVEARAKANPALTIDDVAAYLVRQGYDVVFPAKPEPDKRE